MPRRLRAGGSQQKVNSGAQTVVGVDGDRLPAGEEMARQKEEALKPPPRKKMEAQIERLRKFKAERDQGAGARRAGRAERGRPKAKPRTCTRGLWKRPAPASRMARSAPQLRQVYGFGAPLIVPVSAAASPAA